MYFALPSFSFMFSTSSLNCARAIYSGTGGNGGGAGRLTPGNTWVLPYSKNVNTSLFIRYDVNLNFEQAVAASTLMERPVHLTGALQLLVVHIL